MSIETLVEHMSIEEVVAWANLVGVECDSQFCEETGIEKLI